MLQSRLLDFLCFPTLLTLSLPLSKVSSPIFSFKNFVTISKIEKSRPLKMVPIGCPETSVRNYLYTLQNFPEERRSQEWTLLKLRDEHIYFMLNFFERTMPIHVQGFLKIYCKNDILQSLENRKVFGPRFTPGAIHSPAWNVCRYRGSIVGGYDVLLVATIQGIANEMELFQSTTVHCAGSERQTQLSRRVWPLNATEPPKLAVKDLISFQPN